MGLSLGQSDLCNLSITRELLCLFLSWRSEKDLVNDLVMASMARDSGRPVIVKLFLLSQHEFFLSVQG